MLDTTEETLHQVFTKACGKENSVERVKKIRDYAFVHFRERDDALKALNVTNSEYPAPKWLPKVVIFFPFSV